MQWALERHRGLNTKQESLPARIELEPLKKQQDDSASEGYCSEDREGSSRELEVVEPAVQISAATAPN